MVIYKVLEASGCKPVGSADGSAIATSHLRFGTRYPRRKGLLSKII